MSRKICATDEENSSENRVSKWRKGHESLDSIPSMISDSLPVSGGPSSLIGLTASHVSEQMTRMCLDPDFSPDEVEEKARLISQVSYRMLTIKTCSFKKFTRY